MAKLHVSAIGKAVHAHPGDLNIPVSVSDNLLHFWFFSGQLCMTEHAFPNRRNARRIASVGPDMAVNTLQPEFHVSVVRKRDRLLRRGRKGGEQNKYNLL
jgi:hypothetical protein